jgi:hypothetical protein
VDKEWRGAPALRQAATMPSASVGAIGFWQITGSLRCAASWTKRLCVSTSVMMSIDVSKALSA